MTDEHDTPKLSVIVPVYNDPSGIRTTLDSLTTQTHDDYEVLPVDNASTDDTADVIHAFADDHPNLIHPLEETDVQSSYAARNTGIERATGDVLLFLDADMWAPETWIEEMIGALESKDCDYLGCAVEVVTSEDPTFPERYEAALAFPVETYLEDKQFAPTCALAVRRDVIDAVGPFDERLVSGGDREFGRRVHRAGFAQGFTDETTAYHPARDSIGVLLTKAKRIGRGRAQVRRFHPQENSYPHPLHPINYLPPSPWRLSRRYSGVATSRRSLLGFYCLEYWLKLVQSLSSLREMVSIRSGD